MNCENYERVAKALVESALANYGRLSYAEIAVLPETISETVVISERRGLLTAFIQRKSPTALLVTLQISENLFIDMLSYGFERGLVFSISEPVREATDLELSENGG